MDLISKITVDLIDENRGVIVRAKQRDIGRGVKLTLTANGILFPLLDTDEVNVFFNKPDGHKVCNHCKVENGNALFELTSQTLAAVGKAQVEIEVMRGESRLSNPVFILLIQPSYIDDSAIESSDEFTALQRALNRVQTVVDAGGTVILDEELDEISTNGVQNKALFAKFAEMSEEHAHLTQSKANAIVSKLTGNTAVATDSAKAGFEGLRIFGRSEQFTTTGKNLLEVTAAQATTNGVTYTPNNDGSITANGVATETPSLFIIGYMTVTAGQQYICESGTRRVSFSFRKNDRSVIIHNFGESTLFTATETDEYEVVSRIGGGLTVTNHVFYPMIRLASITDDSWEPYTGGIASPNPDYPQEIESVGDGGSVGVGVHGKNLLLNTVNSLTTNGVAFVVNEDGSITANGTATSSAMLVLANNSNTLADLRRGRYSITGCPSGGSSAGYRMQFWNYDGNEGLAEDYGDGAEFDFTNEGGKYNIAIVVYGGVTVNNITFYPMLRYASVTDDTYEPYQKQSAIFTTPNGLPGIKVTDSSLATYTDENGQMWCADEVDLERGVYVQRIGEVDLGTLTWEYNESLGVWVSATGLSNSVRESKLMCETIPYNGIIRRDPANMGSLMNTPYNIWIQNASTEVTPTGKALYILAPPIETPLSDEEIAKYKALHSNYPTTTVMNDSGADMEVGYVADHKNHIEQNYVPKASYTELEARVSALEQLAINS